MRSTYPKM